jgi:hypothetical protein
MDLLQLLKYMEENPEECRAWMALAESDTQVPPSAALGNVSSNKESSESAP